MPDDTPLSDTELSDIEAAIREDAATFRDALLRRAITPDVALAILGLIAGDLLDRVSPQLRADWLASFEPPNA